MTDEVFWEGFIWGAVIAATLVLIAVVAIVDPPPTAEHRRGHLSDGKRITVGPKGGTGVPPKHVALPWDLEERQP